MNEIPGGALDPGSPYKSSGEVKVVVFAPALYLPACQKAGLDCGAQSARAKESGAFTGDHSIAMFARAGIKYVLCGHSERRKYWHETDADISDQVQAAVKACLTPVLCIGETLEESDAGQTEEVLTRQIDAAQPPAGTIVAYEPVWAIGQKVTPSMDRIDDTLTHIRTLLTATDATLLYGGAVSKDNAAEIFSLPNVNGALIGGAALNPEEFRSINDAAKKIN